MYNTCLKVDRPFRIVSGEHPSRVDDGMAGAAAPIHDRRTGKALGVIGISGYWEKSHGHTMGLSIMAAEAIAQEMELRKVLR
jgi:transcriptional regulator of acetoin/glycerol metabolism